MKRKTDLKALTLIALLASMAMVLSYIEFLLPPIYSAVPGIKLGLPNIVIIFALYRMGVKQAVFVSAVRLALSALLFGTVMTFAYSLAGAVLSLSLMIILRRTGWFSTVGVSIAGGIFHNVGQILVAVLLLRTPQIAYYLLILTVTGIISGAFVGLSGAYLIKKIPNKLTDRR